MKRFFKVLLFSFFLVSFSLKLSFADVINSSANGVILMDAKSGIVLYGKNINAAFPPASTTKLMTALLVFEKTKLDDLVTIGPDAEALVGNGNSSIGIQANEKLSVRDLLYGLILESGNDCAVALAEHISGSEKEFTKLMNERAKELGCKNTNFVTCSGLYEPGHGSSAYDMSLIAKELIKYPTLHEISKTIMHKIEKTDTTIAERFTNNSNFNFLPASRYFYKDMLFAKNGWTPESKHSYVAVAERDGRDLIAVILSDENKNYYSEVKTLFDYGFNNTKIEKLFSKGDVISDLQINDTITVPVIAQNDFYVDNTNNIKDSVTLNVNPALSDIKNSDTIKKDEVLSQVNVIVNGSVLGSVNLLSSKDLVLKTLAASNIINNKQAWIFWFKNSAICIAILVIFSIIIKSNIKRKRSKNLMNK